MVMRKASKSSIRTVSLWRNGQWEKLEAPRERGSRGSRPVGIASSVCCSSSSNLGTFDHLGARANLGGLIIKRTTGEHRCKFFGRGIRDFRRAYVTSILTIRISSSGRSFHTLTPSIFFTTSSPPTARPNTVCFPSNHGQRSVVMKN